MIDIHHDVPCILWPYPGELQEKLALSIPPFLSKKPALGLVPSAHVADKPEAAHNEIRFLVRHPDLGLSADGPHGPLPVRIVQPAERLECDLVVVAPFSYKTSPSRRPAHGSDTLQQETPQEVFALQAPVFQLQSFKLLHALRTDTLRDTRKILRNLVY